MKLHSLLGVNAIVFIALGIAFALYGPLMLGWFGVLESGADVASYWNTAAFSRMFGAGLFGYGLLLWALRSVELGNELSPETRRGVVFALLLANILAVFVSVTQQVSILGGFAGWLLSAMFAVFMLAYGAALVTGQRGKEPKQVHR